MTRARDLGDFIADGAAAELVVDTTTLVVDSTNNRVGIGTASPSQALEVTGTAKLATVDIDAGAIDGAVIGANSAAAVTATTLNASTKLQVNSTDVITNARQLSNIASIDATTAAAITAGGVGGGGTLSFTATGSISAGQVVGLRSDGTVEVISQSQSSTPTAEGTAEVSSNFYSFLASAYDSTNNKVVLAYTDQDASNYIYARAGAISGTTIVWESQILVQGITGEVGAAVYDPDQDRTLVFLKRTGTDNEIYVYGLDSSGTTVSSVGQIGNIQSQSNSNTYVAVYDTNANKTVFMVTTAIDTVTSFVCTLTSGNSLDIQNSGSTCSIGEGDNIFSWVGESPTAVFDSNSNKIIFMVTRSSNTYTYVAVGTVSGTSTTWAGTNNWMNNSWSYPDVAFDTNSNKFLVVYRHSDDSLRANVGSLSGTTVTFSSQQTIDSNTSSHYPAIAFDSNTNRFFITYRVHTSNNGVALFGTISGSTASFSSTTTFSTSNYLFHPPNPTFLHYDDNAQKAVVVYRVSDNDYHGTVLSGTTTNVSTWIGIAAEAISNGASGDITILGGVNENQSSLTINTVYYAQPAGGIGTTSQDYKVGRAISATKLLITEGNA